MAFTIPDEAEAAFPVLARLFQTDIDALVAGQGSTGVISGCAVTAQGTPDMTLAVAAGQIISAGAAATVTAGNVTVTTAHSTLDRLDLVVASSSGTKSVEAGTAAATASVLPPPIPAGSVLLAMVYVPAADTAIGATQLVDKRVIKPVPTSGAGFGSPSSFVPPSGEHIVPAVGEAITTGVIDVGGTTATATTTVVYTPLWVPQDGAVLDAVALNCNVAATDTGAAVRLGLYASDGANGRPGTLIEEAGTASVTTTGLKTVTFATPRTLNRGWVYGAATLRTDGTTAGTNPTFSVIPTNGASTVLSVGLAAHSASWFRIWRGTITADASFPGTAAGLTLVSQVVHRIALRVA